MFKEKIKANKKTTNSLYPMPRELVEETQRSQSLRRRPIDIPRVTDEERQHLRQMMMVEF